MDRHRRQRLLAEVGSAGQARLAGAVAEVRLDGFAGEIAARYLAGAGFGRIMVADAAQARCARDMDPDVHVEVSSTGSSLAVDVFDLRDDAARDLAAGARAALQVIRVVLGVRASDPVRLESEHCSDKGL